MVMAVFGRDKAIKNRSIAQLSAVRGLFGYFLGVIVVPVNKLNYVARFVRLLSV